MRTLSSQSPAVPASAAVPAATQQHDDKDYDEKRGEIHVRDPMEVHFVFRVPRNALLPDQRSRSPFVPSNGDPSPGVIWRQTRMANRKVSRIEQSATALNEIWRYDVQSAGRIRFGKSWIAS